jgi:predicted Zn-dependent protease
MPAVGFSNYMTKAPASALFLLTEARTQRKQGRFAQAEEVLRRGLKAYPDDRRFQVALSDVLFRAGRTADARRALAPVLEDAAGDVTVLLLMGDIHLKEEEPALALERFQQAARLQDSCSVQTRIARAHVDLRELPRAEECLRRAIEKDPDDGFALRLLARCRRERGDRAGAVHILEGILKRNPDDRLTYADYVRAKVEGLPPESKLSELKGILRGSARRDVQFLHSQLGDTLKELGRYGEAVEAYERALALRPGDSGPLRAMGFCLHHMGRHDRVIDLLRGPFLENPADAFLRTTLEAAYHKNKDEGGFRALLEEARKRKQGGREAAVRRATPARKATRTPRRATVRS